MSHKATCIPTVTVTWFSLDFSHLHARSLQTDSDAAINGLVVNQIFNIRILAQVPGFSGGGSGRLS